MKKKETGSELTSKGSAEDTLLLHDLHKASDMEREAEIKKTIYTIRGVQVMLDRDLAALYEVETKQLKRQVQRNIERFPPDFMFQLTREELHFVENQSSINLRCHFGTSSWGGLRYLPYAFTEQGVSQLSGVISSRKAIEMNIQIMRAFIAMRRFITANAGLFQRIEFLEEHQHLTDQKVEKVLQRMEELAPSISTEQLFPNGCVWDAYSYVSALIRSAKEQVILIDNYVDETVLTLLDKRAEGVRAVIHSRFSESFLKELERHNKQYPEVEFTQFPHKVHDRFLIIDQQVYLLGNSLKDMGHTLSAAILTGFSVDEVLRRLEPF